MAEGCKDALRLNFGRKLKLESYGAKVTGDASLLAYRELDEALGWEISAPAGSCGLLGLSVESLTKKWLRVDILATLPTNELTTCHPLLVEVEVL
jgi:O-acetyl-ADP-ribose deacetylase (regulator of RNase III)